MAESYSFPGSACDLGECICPYCEDDRDCPYHRTGRYAEGRVTAEDIIELGLRQNPEGYKR